MTRPAGRRGLGTVPGSPWAVMLRHGLAIAVGVGLAVTSGAAIAGGAQAGTTAAAASLLVGVPFAASGVALWASSRVASSAPPLVMLLLYLVLVLGGALLLAAVPRPPWLSPGWAVAAAVSQTTGWLAGLAVGLRRARLPLGAPGARRAGAGASTGDPERVAEPASAHRRRNAQEPT